jgi:transposase
MRMFAGRDVGFKRTAVCVVDEAGRILWRGVVDTHPEALSKALRRWEIGLESGSMTPWLARELCQSGVSRCCAWMRARRRMRSRAGGCTGENVDSQTCPRNDNG